MLQGVPWTGGQFITGSGGFWYRQCGQLSRASLDRVKAPKNWKITFSFSICSALNTFANICIACGVHVLSSC